MVGSANIRMLKKDQPFRSAAVIQEGMWKRSPLLSRTMRLVSRRFHASTSAAMVDQNVGHCHKPARSIQNRFWKSARKGEQGSRAANGKINRIAPITMGTRNR